ncbi:MAG: hypothetical protein LBE34_10295 [Flavobacteriaceae bacterium]|nr:hypothetical protein [Flavobacteriaceae bacterium]
MKHLRMHRRSIILIIAICSFMSCSKKRVENLNLIYNHTDTIINIEKLNIDIVYNDENTKIILKSIKGDSLDVRVIDLVSKSDGYYIKFNDLIYDEFKMLEDKPFLTMKDNYDYKIDISALDSIKYDSYNYKINDDSYAKVVTMYPIPSFFFKVIYNTEYEILALEYNGGYRNYRFESEAYSKLKSKHSKIRNKYVPSSFVNSIKEDSIKFDQKYDKWW